MDTRNLRVVATGVGAVVLLGLSGCWGGTDEALPPPPPPPRPARARPADEPVAPAAKETTPDEPAEPEAVAPAPDGGWRFERDDAGRVVATDGPAGPTRLGRDAAGRVVERADATGRVIRLRFDGQGRPIAFETGDHVEALTYGPSGRLVEATAGAERLTYEVDAPAPGALRARVHDHAAGVTLRYESASRRQSVETPYGATTWHEDALGRVVRLETPAGPFTWAHDDATGEVTHTAPNGVRTRLGRDAAAGVERVESRGPRGAVLVVERVRDVDLRVVSAVRDGDEARFTYDAQGRLASVEPAAGGAARARVAYDAHGDRVAVDDVRLEHDARGRLLRASDGRAFSHDAAGRLTELRHAAGVDRFEYDPFGRLAAVTRAGAPRVAYTYDPLGRVATRAVDGAVTRYVYDGPRLLAELSRGSAGPRRRVYVFGPGLDQPLAYRDDQGPWTFLHADPLGHVLAYSDGAGARVDRAAFDAWGALTRAPAAGRPVFFAGRLVDPVAGLVHLRARFYDPALGRFLTPDPAGLLGGANGYAYALNDPLGRVDPLGLWDELPEWLRARLRPLAEGLPPGLRQGLAATATALWSALDPGARETLRPGPAPMELWVAEADRRVSEVVRGLEPTSKEYLFLEGELIGLGRATAAGVPELAYFLHDVGAAAIAAGHDAVFAETSGSMLEAYEPRSALSEVAARGKLLELVIEGLVDSDERIAEASRRTGILVEQRRYQEAGEVFGEVVLAEAIGWITLVAGLAEQGVNVARLAPAQRKLLLKEALELGYRPGARGPVLEQVAARARSLLRRDAASPSTPAAPLTPRQARTGLAQVLDPDTPLGAATQVAEAPRPLVTPETSQPRPRAPDADDAAPTPAQGDANRARGPPSEVSAPARSKTRGQPEEQLTDRGRLHPAPLTANELDQVQRWSATRNGLLKKWRERSLENYPAQTRRLLRNSSDNAIRDRMSPDDAAAVFKENRGVQIFKPDGRTPFDHADECLAARDSLSNTIEGIQERLIDLRRTGRAVSNEVEALRERLHDLSTALDEYPRPVKPRESILQRRAARAAAAEARARAARPRAPS